MEPLDNQAMGSDDLTPTAKSALFATRPWMMFFAILGFIYSGLMVLGSIASIVGGGMVSGVLILLVVLFIGYMFFLLFRSAQNIKRFREGSTVALEAALKDYKTYWMIWGIILIILVGIVALGILSTLFIGASAL